MSRNIARVCGSILALFLVAFLAPPVVGEEKGASQSGGFTESDWITFKTEQGPNQVISADLDADGILDIVTVNSTNNSISIMKGQGNGLFGSPTKINLPGQTPYSVAAGRLGGGSTPDLVVANLASSSLSIFYADGKGGYRPPVQVATEKAPMYVVTGDLDGDGLDDIAILNMERDTVTVLFNNSNHTFKADLVLATPKSPVFLAIADLRHNGHKDIITANNEAGTIAVFRNEGNRKFSDAANYETGSGPVALSIADLNGDGVPDIVTANEDAGTVSVLIGKGDASFTHAKDYPVRHPQNIVVADVDGDKKMDVIVPERESDTLAVLLNDGTGGLQEPVRIRTKGEHLTSLVAADFNRDGKADVLGASFVSGAVAVLLQDIKVPQVVKILPNPSFRVHALGLGINQDVRIQFNTALSPATLTDQSVLVYGSMSGFHKAHLKYDAEQHMVILRPKDGLYEKNRKNAFKVGELVTLILTDQIRSSAGIPMKHGHVADFDIRPTTGTGEFKESQRVYCVKIPGRLRAADMNNDGHVDVVAMCREVDSVRIYFNDGKANLGHSVTLPTKGNGPWDLWVADLNRDGIMDIAIVNTFTSDLVVMYGLGERKFAPPLKIASGAGPMGVIAADVNADGWLDLVTVTKGGPEALVFLNDHKGGFEKPISYKVSPSPYHLTARDLNGDGTVDLMMTNLESDRGTILLNQGDGTFVGKQEFPLLLAKALVGCSWPCSPCCGTWQQISPAAMHWGMGIVTVNTASDDISLFRADGKGQYKEPIKYAVGATPTDQVVGDFNADGYPDIAVTLDGGKVAVLLNNADASGGLHKTADLKVGDNPTSPILADFNEDGSLDLMVANQYSHDLSVLLNPPNAEAAAKVANKPVVVSNDHHEH